jgi:hypothetical protein
MADWTAVGLVDCLADYLAGQKVALWAACWAGKSETSSADSMVAYWAAQSGGTSVVDLAFYSDCSKAVRKDFQMAER